MAENLLANQMLGKNEIKDFLSQKIDPLISRDQGAYIDKMKNQLMQLREESLRLEQQAYSLFMVKNIEQLQEKLDIINKSGLMFFSNRVLARLPAIKETKEGTISKEVVRKAVDETFQNYLEQQGIHDIDAITEKELNALFNKMSKESGRGARYKFITKIETEGISKIIYNISGSVKRSLAKEYGITVKTHYDNDSIIVEYNDQNEAVSAKLKSYPYFALNQEQQKDAMHNVELWNKFKLALRSCVSEPALQYTIEEAMVQMGLESFVSTGGSYQDIVGILGELQGMVILKYLTKQNSKAEFLGHVLDEGGKKIGIDLALEGIGFQVKNYATIQTNTGDEVLNLGKDYTLKGFLNVVERALYDQEARPALEQFYAISAYHLTADKDFKETRERLDALQNEELPRLYHGAVADLLPLKSLNLLDGRNMRNVFYLIGGTKVLPVSAILTRFINFLNSIDERKKILTTRLSYSGTTYKDYYKNGIAFPGYGSVANQIGIHYNVRLSIDSTIQEALSI